MIIRRSISLICEINDKLIFYLEIFVGVKVKYNLLQYYRMTYIRKYLM